MARMEQIRQFAGQKHIAVAGISRTSHKFGNNAFRELKKKDYTLYPVSKHLEEFEGVKCFTEISALPAEVSGLLIVTKPEQTKILVDEAIRKGIGNIWLQQGSADKQMIKEYASAKANIITGECILMFSEPTGGMHKFHRFLKKTFGKLPS